MNYQNGKGILFLSYFFLCSNTLKNKTNAHTPPQPPKYWSTYCIFTPDHRMKNWCPFSTLEMTTDISIFPIYTSEFLTEKKFPSIFRQPFPEKQRHLCRHIKETPHFKIQCIQGDIIKVYRDGASPVVTVCLTSQVTTEQLFPLHHQKKYCLSFYIHDTFFVTSFLKLFLFAQCI